MAGAAAAVTLRDVAERAGVNKVTVSVVLNGSNANTRVSEATRQRILTAARELHYRPNAAARSLRQSRTNTLGVLFGWSGAGAMHSLYSAVVFDGVVKGATEAGYHVLLYTDAWHSAEVSSAAFADRRTDGVIVVAPLEGSDVVEGLTALGLPVSVVSTVTGVLGVSSVDIDNRAGAALALDHLWALGHTRIAYVSYHAVRRGLRERRDGFLAWMGAHGIPVPDGYVMDEFIGSAETGANADEVAQLGRLLRLPPAERPTAVFAANDDLAAKVLDAARTFGLSVPGDLSVVGFDDILIASLTTPKLTTVRQPLYEMGGYAARRLAERIAARGASAESTADTPDYSPPSLMANIITPELVIRESTAAAPPQ
jgi:LacI family transcriptional regulator